MSAQEMACLLHCTAYALYISCTKLSQNLEALWDFHHLFGSRNSPTTIILLTVHHVYGNMRPVRESKPHFGVTLVRSAHDCETCQLLGHFKCLYGDMAIIVTERKFNNSQNEACLPSLCCLLMCSGYLEVKLSLGFCPLLTKLKAGWLGAQRFSREAR